MEFVTDAAAAAAERLQICNDLPGQMLMAEGMGVMSMSQHQRRGKGSLRVKPKPMVSNQSCGRPPDSSRYTLITVEGP